MSKIRLVSPWTGEMEMVVTVYKVEIGRSPRQGIIRQKNSLQARSDKNAPTIFWTRQQNYVRFLSHNRKTKK